MIWILWGMWPLASANFYNLIIEISTRQYRIVDNYKFPQILLDNIPVQFPAFDMETKSCPTIKETIKTLSHEIDRLSDAGANLFWMPCNTFHLYIWDLRRHLWERGKFIGMVEETARRAKEEGHTHIGILWTQTTIELWLYDREFDSTYTIHKLDNHGRNRTVQAIINVVWWSILKEDINFLKWAIQELKNQWATCVILWCTELPLLAEQISDPAIQTYNPMRILAEEILKNHFRYL
jgi:aspartate racemase